MIYYYRTSFLINVLWIYENRAYFPDPESTFIHFSKVGYIRRIGVQSDFNFSATNINHKKSNKKKFQQLSFDYFISYWLSIYFILQNMFLFYLINKVSK